MTAAGDQYLLTLDELVAPEEEYDAWHITLRCEGVRLPLGAAGGPPIRRGRGRSSIATGTRRR